MLYFKLQHSVSIYCYGFIKVFRLWKNFSNEIFFLKYCITFVSDLQGHVEKHILDLLNPNRDYKQYTTF